MLLSVIIPVYNVEKYLSRCLESVLDQDITEDLYEILIIDDASPDTSLAIAKDFQSKHSNIKIISQENKGLSGARNTGIKNAKGNYLYFIDSDDYIERKAFGKLIQVAIKYDLDFLGFKNVRTSLSDYASNPDYDKIINEFQESSIEEGVAFMSKVNYQNGAWWFLVKRDFLHSIGLLFEEGRMAEDGIFITELLINCKKATWLDLNLYRYYVNTNSIVTNKSKAHLEKINDDFRFVLFKFSSLLKLAKDKNCDANAFKRIKCRQESYLFFLFVRFLKSNVSFEVVQKQIKDVESLDVYPMKNFIGLDYNSKQEKILTYIFNRPILFFLVLKFNKVFKVVK